MNTDDSKPNDLGARLRGHGIPRSVPLFAACLVLWLTLNPEVAKAFSLPTCDQFKTRLAQAEDAIHRPIPAIKFSEETNLSPLVKSHEFDLVDVLGIEATLHCKSSGEFSDFTLEYDGIEKYAMQRVENLMIAATWAFTRWPPSQASASVEELFAKATANLKDDIIRGGKAASGGVRFFRGNADIGITNDVTISLDGSQINDGPFSTQFLIDASCAGGCDDK